MMILTAGCFIGDLEGTEDELDPEVIAFLCTMNRRSKPNWILQLKVGSRHRRN